MAEINNSLAMQVNSAPIDLKSTLGTLSQIQLSQAHAGLYGLQAQQEARKLNALEYLKQNPSDYMGYIQQGGDPANANTLQTMMERDRQYKTNPQGLSTESTLQLTSAGKNIAETGKVNAETRGINIEQSAKFAQGVISDPSNDSVWTNTVNRYYETNGGSSLERQQLLAVKDPATRLRIAKAYAAQGVAPSTFGTPHTKGPTDATITPSDSYASPQPAANSTLPPPAQQGGMIGAPGERIIGGAIVQGNGGNIPNERVSGGHSAVPLPQVPAGGLGVRPPAMTPGQAAESKAYGEEMAKVLPALAEKANNSRQANFTLDQMRQESQTWNMGKGGTALMEAAKYAKSALATLGIDSSSLDKSVADFESFQKNTGTLVRQAVKEVSPRAAVQEFQLIQNQLPSATMSRGGFNQIVDQFQAVNDFNIAKAQAGQAWREKTGTMDGFETEWNKNVTPSAFLVSRLPPEQLGALRANLQRTPEGRATLQSITKQLQWAQDHKLDELVR